MAERRHLAIWRSEPVPAAVTPGAAALWTQRNLALDEVLLLGLAAGTAGPTLRCYCNPPSVILGLSRRLTADVHVATCRARGVTIARRISGGGTVYHDPLVLNVAWVLPWSWLPGCGPKSLQDATTPTILGCLIAALGQLGWPATQTRISDVSIGTPLRKIAGSGQARKAAGVLHHCSILVDLDLAAINACLPNPPDRPDIDHANFITSLRAERNTPGVPGPSTALLQQVEEAIIAASLLQFVATATSAGPTLAQEEQVLGLVATRYSQAGWVDRL